MEEAEYIPHFSPLYKLFFLLEQLFPSPLCLEFITVVKFRDLDPDSATFKGL